MTSGVQWDVGLTDQGNCAEMMSNQNVKTPSFALHLWSEQICQDDELSCICGAECPCVFSEAHACKREKSVCFSRYEYCDFQQYQVKSADFVFCAVSEGESEMSQMFLRRLRSRYCTCVCVLGVNLDYCHVDLINLISVKLLHALHSFLITYLNFNPFYRCCRSLLNEKD